MNFKTEKIIMKKIILTLSFCAAIAIAFVYAKEMTPPPPESNAYEASTESYNNMEKSERMDMLTKLKVDYTAAGQMKAAAYIQGQMEMLENK